jgi:hypothetical protein
MNVRKYQWIAVSIVLALLAGCNKGYVSMGGRVTYSDNGDPLEKGTVAFMTSTFQARGKIGADGRYTIGTLSDTDGLPKGTYQVFVTSSEDFQWIDELTGTYITTYRIDGKFANPETSGLTVEVDGKTKTFDFQVDRYVAPTKAVPRRNNRPGNN